MLKTPEKPAGVFSAGVTDTRLSAAESREELKGGMGDSTGPLFSLGGEKAEEGAPQEEGD